MTHDTKAPEVMAPRADASSEPGAGAARPLEASAAVGRSPEARSPMVASGGASAPGASPARSEPDEDAGEAKAKRNKKRGPKPNNLRRLRIERMMSKAELARRANLSVLTIDRVEKGYGCRMDTKRKILEALGLSLADRVRVFGEEE
jgi:DNA-binding XRE family transcriptional regulator